MAEKQARAHDTARSIVCCACGKKDLKCHKVTDSIEATVKQEIFKAYSAKDVYFPSGICGVCRWILTKNKIETFLTSDGVKERDSDEMDRKKILFSLILCHFFCDSWQFPIEFHG